MSLKISPARSTPAAVDSIVIALASEACSDRALKARGLPVAALKAQGFSGAVDQVAFVADVTGRSTIVLGAGPSKEVDGNRLRRLGAQAVRAGSRSKRVSVDVLELMAKATPTARSAAIRCVAEGIVLGSYRFTEYRSDPKPVVLAAVTVVGVSGKAATDAFAQGLKIGEAQNFARDLVNRPGGDLTPAALAEEAQNLARRERLKIEVLNLAQIRRQKLGGLLGVNRGSTNEPRFVKITYTPRSPKGTLALVGKGITFDSGGLSLKTGEGMMTMKMDMGGAAAVLGCFAAIRAVAPKCQVVGYMPMTDNMVNGDATRPGDVLTIRNGTTVEVLNTDAEGRLVLADALSLATEDAPDAIVDLATLTGAVEVALGGRIAAVMSNNVTWLGEVGAAAESAGERMWALPLPADYRAFIESDVADLRNISKSRGGGTITAGLFLQEFVGDGIPWAHIDIAGTAWSAADDGETAKGGTGYGVRTLLELARTFTPRRRS
ncbi:MAG: leucyl aminopeptidase [Acidimicrobiales bacterium]